MLYKHGKWTVEVSEHEDFRRIEYDVSFRRTIRLDKECELFTLLKKNTDEALLQMQLFDDGTIHSEVYSPSLMQIYAKKKFVLVGIFDTSNWPHVP